MTKEMIDNIINTEAYQDLLNEYCESNDYCKSDFEQFELSEIFNDTETKLKNFFPDLIGAGSVIDQYRYLYSYF